MMRRIIFANDVNVVKPVEYNWLHVFKWFKMKDYDGLCYITR